MFHFWCHELVSNSYNYEERMNLTSRKLDNISDFLTPINVIALEIVNIC